MSADAPIRHDAQNGRFVIGEGANTAELTYARTGNALDYRHTFVPPALRNRGIASELAHFALRYARDNGLEVIPSCPFIASFIRRNPQYGDLVGG